MHSYSRQPGAIPHYANNRIRPICDAWMASTVSTLERPQLAGAVGTSIRRMFPASVVNICCV
jgi:hypothetical protein